jgi:hypothetical protein
MMDIYRYDSRSGTLQCVSCLPGGDGQSAGMEIPPGNDHTLFDLEPVGFPSRGRWASEDGNTVVFVTKAALVPEDTNGVFDDYMWRDGELYRLPASGGTVEDTPTVSADGSSVAFRSSSELLPEDGDSVEDAYVARVGGGFPIPPAKEICVGEVCQEPFRAQPGTSAPGSETASGGNVSEPPPVRCRKGFVKRNGKCVKRHRRKHHTRKHHHSKRAAGNRGGGR